MQKGDSRNLKLLLTTFCLDRGGCGQRTVERASPSEQIPDVTAVVTVVERVDLPIALMREFMQNLDDKIEAYVAAAKGKPRQTH